MGAALIAAAVVLGTPKFFGVLPVTVQNVCAVIGVAMAAAGLALYLSLNPPIGGRG